MADKVIATISNILAAGAAMLICWVAYYAIIPTLAALEARLFPVVVDFEIVSQESFGDHTDMYVRFKKNRDCEFLGVNWYRGDDRLPLTFMEDGGGSVLSRPIGNQVTGPWRLDAASIDGTYATAVHRCHGEWLTQTLLLDARKGNSKHEYSR